MANPASAAASGGRPKMITALFRDRDRAERGYQAVVERGYGKDDINLLMSDETRARHFPANNTELADKADEGTGKTTGAAAELGGPVGGTIGTLAPALAAAGALMLIPGLVIAGPVAIALAAAGTVGLAGGLIGAVADWGVPKGRVEEYEAGIRSGGILLAVKPRSEEDASYIEQRWRENGGELILS